MPAKPCLALAGLALALSGCQKSPAAPSAASGTPETVVAVPTPARSATLSVTPKPTACGAEMLQNYLNLLPTSTAKEEIARTLGHDRIRYVPLQQEKAEASPGSTRVLAGLGVDGRIKEFACG